MNRESYENQTIRSKHPIQYTTLVDPYVVDALKTLIGKSVVIETVRGNLQGIVADVKPDHVVVESYDNDTLFFC